MMSKTMNSTLKEIIKIEKDLSNIGKGVIKLDKDVMEMFMDIFTKVTSGMVSYCREVPSDKCKIVKFLKKTINEEMEVLEKALCGKGGKGG